MVSMAVSYGMMHSFPAPNLNGVGGGLNTLNGDIYQIPTINGGGCSFEDNMMTLQEQKIFKENPKMFVGQIPKTHGDDQMRDFFEKKAMELVPGLVPNAVSTCNVLSDKVTLESRGCCFVQFIEGRIAAKLMRELHNVFYFEGMKHPLQMKPANSEKTAPVEERKLFIGMLPRDLLPVQNETALREAFQRYGEIESLVVLKDNRDGTANTSKHRGCAFLTFTAKESADRALAQTQIGSVTENQYLVEFPGYGARSLTVKRADTSEEKERRRTGRRDFDDNRITVLGESSMGMFNPATLMYSALSTPNPVNGTADVSVTSPNLFGFTDPSGMQIGHWNTPYQFTGPGLDASSVHGYNLLGGLANADRATSPGDSLSLTTTLAASLGAINGLGAVPTTLTGANLINSTLGAQALYPQPHSPTGGSTAALVNMSLGTNNMAIDPTALYNNFYPGLSATFASASSPVTTTPFTQYGASMAVAQNPLAGANFGLLSGADHNSHQLAYNHSFDVAWVNAEPFMYEEFKKKKEYFRILFLSKDIKNPVGKMSPGSDGCNLFVYHLPIDCDDMELALMFSQFGQLLSVKVYVDKNTHSSKCFGFVSYSSPVAANDAIHQMHGMLYRNNKTLKVDYKKSKGNDVN